MQEIERQRQLQRGNSFVVGRGTAVSAAPPRTAPAAASSARDADGDEAGGGGQRSLLTQILAEMRRANRTSDAALLAAREQAAALRGIEESNRRIAELLGSTIASRKVGMTEAVMYTIGV